MPESWWPAHCAWRGGAEVALVPGNPGPSSIAAELGGSSGNTSTAPWLRHSSARLHKEPRSSTAGSLKPAPHHLPHPPVPCHSGGAPRQQGHPPPQSSGRPFLHPQRCPTMNPEAGVAQVRENESVPRSPSTGKQKGLNSLNLRCAGGERENPSSATNSQGCKVTV